ncbi:MAG: DUF5686 family protein [Candidatus Azobacteroides sp.]|nr:DUF5686 family protein [Candidatus Azobacteroides sp.]
MKTIHIQLLLLLTWIFSFLPVSAQYSPAEIRYSVMDFRALRYYPFTTNADSIVRKVMEQGTESSSSSPAVHRKTSIQLVANELFLEDQLIHLVAADSWIYKRLFQPYMSWLQYAVPLKTDAQETALTIGLIEEDQNDRKLQLSKHEGIYDFIGKQNVARLLKETLGEIDLFKSKNKVMQMPFKGPLSPKHKNAYRYFLSAQKMLADQPVYEIAFYPKNACDRAFIGYLYITADEHYSLVKASFTLSDWSEISLVKNILFVQTFENKENRISPIHKESFLMAGHEIAGCFLVNQTTNYTDTITSLSVSEKQIEPIVQIASQTRAFRNWQNGMYLLMTDHLKLGGKKGKFEWGPVDESLSYNQTEGIRIKAAGNTTLNLNKRFLFGGYLAYGFNDKRFKYKGEVVYSFLPKTKDIGEFPKRLLSVSYIHDLNVPGNDLTTSNRDNIFYSFSHSYDLNLSLQKLFTASYEQEGPRNFSFKIGGQRLYDRPVGSIQYVKGNGDRIVPHVTSSELNFSLRYAPNEMFFQNRESRWYIHRGAIEFNIRHRIGIKGFLGSDYGYQITDFSIFKRFYFPQHIGTMDVQLSGGKVWSRVPFPLLFIPIGNISYIFKETDYNLMNYYEFVIDRFIAGNIDCQFNWSPFRWFSRSKWFSGNTIKTTFGLRTIYGPLSSNNDPRLHPDLFRFSQGVRPLDNEPYAEMNIGFSNIFKLFRVEWVRRLSYLEPSGLGKKVNKASLLVTTTFSF